MTDIEIMRGKAKQLLIENKLTGRNKEFVVTILKYNKKRFTELSSKQFSWLKNIVDYPN
jgi:hypothetical protein